MKKKNIFIIFSVGILVIILFFIFKGNITGFSIASNEKPNIILITIETLRTDHMSTYGYERETTPNIDKLAEKGVLFTNHIGPSGDSGPTLISLFTSKHPVSHGVHQSGKTLKLDEYTLAEILRDEGYTTFGIVPFVTFSKISETNYDQGFDIYAGTEVIDSESNTVILYNPDELSLFKALIDKYNGVDLVQITKKLIKDIEETLKKVGNLNEIKIVELLVPNFEKIINIDSCGRKEGKPLFFWMHLFGAHTPHYGHFDIFAHPNTKNFIQDLQKSTDELTDPDNPSMKTNTHELWPWVYDFKIGNEPSTIKPITDLNFFKTLYDEDIHSTDQYIGDIIKKLEEGNLLDNTVIIITGDHGETLGEEGMFFIHGFSIKDVMIKVPLIIYYPEKLEPRVINYQTSRLDTMPTILDLIGIDKSNLDLEGKNLLEEETEFVFLENMHCNREIIPNCYPHQNIEGQKKAIRSNKYKLIMTPTEQGKFYELFDLEKDPQELNNIYNKNDEISKSLKKKLDDWIAQGQEHIDNEMSDRVKESLKSLGYIF